MFPMVIFGCREVVVRKIKNNLNNLWNDSSEQLKIAKPNCIKVFMLLQVTWKDDKTYS